MERLHGDQFGIARRQLRRSWRDTLSFAATSLFVLLSPSLFADCRTEPEQRLVSFTVPYIPPDPYWGYQGGGPFNYADAYDFANRALTDALAAYSPTFHYFGDPITPVFTRGGFWLHVAYGSAASRWYYPNAEPLQPGWYRTENLERAAIDLHCPNGSTLVVDFTMPLGFACTGTVCPDACPVGPLTPFEPDPYPLNTDNLTQRAKDAISCLEACSGQSRSTFLSSAYRPVAYQDHLREVWSKWNDELKLETNPACVTLKTRVKKEFDDHGLGASAIPPSRTSCHTAGGCVDVNRSFTETVDFCSTQCNVYRPWPEQDPVHVLPY